MLLFHYTSNNYILYYTISSNEFPQVIIVPFVLRAVQKMQNYFVDGKYFYHHSECFEKYQFVTSNVYINGQLSVDSNVIIRGETIYGEIALLPLFHRNEMVRNS